MRTDLRIHKAEAKTGFSIRLSDKMHRSHDASKGHTQEVFSIITCPFVEFLPKMECMLQWLKCQRHTSGKWSLEYVCTQKMCPPKRFCFLHRRKLPSVGRHSDEEKKTKCAPFPLSKYRSLFSSHALAYHGSLFEQEMFQNDSPSAASEIKRII